MQMARIKPITAPTVTDLEMNKEIYEHLNKSVSQNRDFVNTFDAVRLEFREIIVEMTTERRFVCSA